VFQEVLIVREYHVVERMVVPHEDACIIVDILEFDGITIKCHFVTAGVIIEPKVVEAVTRSLSFVGGVTYIKHDSWFLAEELFKDSGHHFKNLWVVGAMFMLSVIDEKVIGQKELENVKKQSNIIKNELINQIIPNLKTKIK
jgi:hypothetical protein